MSPIIHILTGPTAVGKTDLAIAWAEAHDAEIISCDSLLVYCGMDIGTAKPPPAAMKKVVHHLIDSVQVSQRFSVKHYQEAAVHATESIISRGKKVLVTGGSGFYLKTFFKPVIDAVEADASIVNKVDQIEKEQGLAGLLSALEKCDPNCKAELDINNPRRVSKALQRCLASGKTLSMLKAEFAQVKSPFNKYIKKVILLERDPDDLTRRIEQRVDSMINNGLVAEVEQLIAAKLEANPSAAAAIGYRETIDYIKSGSRDLDSLKQLLCLNTRRLVAKQRKWFRNHLEPDRILNLSHEHGPIEF